MKSQITFPSLYPYLNSYGQSFHYPARLWPLPLGPYIFTHTVVQETVEWHLLESLPSLFPTTVLSICLTVCCVLRTSNHAQIETLPPENKCVSSTPSFERDTGRREENQDHENFMNLPTGRRTELVTLSPKEKGETGGKNNLVKKKVNLLCRHFRCQNRKGQRF